MAFKDVVKRAVGLVINEQDLIKVHSGSLYTPMFAEERWVWKDFSTPDGLLLKEHDVERGVTGDCDAYGKVFSGILVQSEEATSNELLNPWGKASIVHLPGGIWVDVQGAIQVGRTRPSRHRVRLTFLNVLFITPEYIEGHAQRGNYVTRRRILDRVALASQSVRVLGPKHDVSEGELKKEIWSIACGLLAPQTILPQGLASDPEV